MTRLSVLILLIFISCSAFAQDDHRMTSEDFNRLPGYSSSRLSSASPAAILTPPQSPVRTIAEWEELQGLVVAWASFNSMLREIIRAAREECTVYVLYEPPSTQSSVANYLLSGGVDTSNVALINMPINSVWCRDYGPWSVYTNDVDSLLTIDWIYNRPRPDDDAVPAGLAALLGTPLYQTVSSPWDLVNTGGNFMTDGLGTGFASELILHDNSLAAGFNVNHTSAEIDTILNRFMGISRYIKMPTLPYDAIHHIDMHMKLLDEETLLVGEYPQGIADGPQIEANLQYVLANYNSVYGTPYKVIRIPMPSQNGLYPHNGGDYFTYTNSSFINNTIIVPVYDVPEDSLALSVYRNALPGYNVIGINSEASIPSLGALHCITKEIGSDDPLLISHQPLPNTSDTLNGYNVNARIQHRSGILNATLNYTTDTTSGFIPVPMTNAGSYNFTAQIPAMPSGTDVFYYINAESVSGKNQVRPMPAPTGTWKFNVNITTGISENTTRELITTVYPNPASAITCIEFDLIHPGEIHADLSDITGRKIMNISSGNFPAGSNKIFFNAGAHKPGVYIITITTDSGRLTSKLTIR